MITHGSPLKAFSLQPIYLSSYTDSSLPNYSGVAQLACLGRTCPRSGTRRARGERPLPRTEAKKIGNAIGGNGCRWPPGVAPVVAVSGVVDVDRID